MRTEVLKHVIDFNRRVRQEIHTLSTRFDAPLDELRS